MSVAVGRASRKPSHQAANLEPRTAATRQALPACRICQAAVSHFPSSQAVPWRVRSGCGM